MDADVSFFSSFMVTLLPVTASFVSLVTFPSLSIMNLMLAAILYPSGAAVSDRVYVPAVSFTVCVLTVPFSFFPSSPDVHLIGIISFPSMSVPVIWRDAPSSSVLLVRSTLLISMSRSVSSSTIMIFSTSSSPTLTFPSLSTVKLIGSAMSYPFGAFVSVRV